MATLLDKYETHPAADLFPLMDDEALKALAADIKAHGLRDPVIIHDGKVLDGRNRLLACDLVHVKARLDPWTGLGSPVEWVLSKNLHRRHLDSGQRAMVGAASLPMLEAEAKERMVAGKAPDPGANLPEGGRARDKAASSVNVSPRSIAHAAKVIKQGTPELQEAVRDGSVAVSAAAEVADEPEERQRELVAEGPKAVRDAAKAKRESRHPEPELEEDEPTISAAEYARKCGAECVDYEGEERRETAVERFVLRVRALSTGSTRTAEHLRAELRSALEALDSAQ